RQADGLYVGELELLPREPRVEFPEELGDLRSLLRKLLEELGAPYARITPELDDATWVGYRLAELLPLPGATRQALLELEDPRERLEALRPHVDQLETQTA
ncbi:MAG TPA: peptidase S16, partial [Gammaproteobacteria bacterium]|nr:peptidase S16 [Gammaproteobacteria bacterium]